jgi:hypothetical protein
MCSSGVPWEKFKRATSNPAKISASITSGELLAGPSVATIFVLRMVIPIPFRHEDALIALTKFESLWLAEHPAIAHEVDG